ncbi:MAG: GNAT family N-acetyltransferase [Lentisphaeraceae bacterium]|nr:GNAT family N-acetyltransferase [Lentisphaeraceae bacterium]
MFAPISKIIKCNYLVNQVISEIIVRSAQVSDADAIVSFNLAMALETENLALDKDVLNKGVRAVFADDSRGQYWVAELENQVIGSLLITKEWSDWRNSQVAWIQSLFVLPEFRGNGVFKKMFTSLEERVASGEFAGIRLYADKTNVAACEIYKKLNMDCEHYLMFEKMK